MAVDAATSGDVHETKEQEQTVVPGDAEVVSTIAQEQEQEQTHEEEEETLTMHDVLQQQSELNETADAVLGDCSADNCSYALGYLRQAVYACLTCTPPSAETPAGVCLACSYHCHADHELVELYTKRNFRCDCGNSKFPKTHPCSLEANKSEENARNVYSQNFMGTYCTCHRPYPDPERTTAEVMVQCIVCEDWFHEEHVFKSREDAGTDKDVTDKAMAQALAMPDNFDEFICRSCMQQHPFLHLYQRFSELETSPKNAAGSEVPPCVLERLEALPPSDGELSSDPESPSFWMKSWRTHLCTCSRCIARFEKEQIAFLMDVDDSLQAYEARGSQGLPEQDQQRPLPTSSVNNSTDSNGMVSSTMDAAMSSVEHAAERAFQTQLSHEQQVAMALGYSHMKQKLQTYLSTFAATGKTVRAEDITGFFEDLRATKRARTE